MEDKRVQPRERPGLSRGRVILICALAALLSALLVLLLVNPFADHKDNGGADDANAGWFDPSAQSGSLPGRTQEEIQAELDKIVEEGMFNISIASVVVFADGQSEGEARIENIAANRYNMGVAITLDESGEVLYTSKGLKPGQYIETIRLDRDLPAGEYQATALFTAYTQEELLKVGQAAARITIVIDG